MADLTTARMSAGARSHGRRTWPIVALGTMCSALPVFLTGALGVQLNDDVGLSATQIGLAMGASFTAAALLSAPMGRVAELLGPRRGFRLGIASSASSSFSVTKRSIVSTSSSSFLSLDAACALSTTLSKPAAKFAASSSNLLGLSPIITAGAWRWTRM